MSDPPQTGSRIPDPSQVDVPAEVAEAVRRLLERTVAWLEKEAQGGRHHPSLARDCGGLARLVALGDVERTAEGLLAEAPVHAFPSIRASDPDTPAPADPDRTLPDPQTVAFDYPPFDHDWVRGYLGNFEDDHVARALAGDDEGARNACDGEADREEMLAVVAFRGDPRVALDELEEAGLPPERRTTPRLVAAVEACRAGDHALAAQVTTSLLEDGAPWDWVQLAAGYLGRVPWNGYPLPD